MSFWVRTIFLPRALDIRNPFSIYSSDNVPKVSTDLRLISCDISESMPLPHIPTGIFPPAVVHET